MGNQSLEKPSAKTTIVVNSIELSSESFALAFSGNTRIRQRLARKHIILEAQGIFKGFCLVTDLQKRDT